MGASIILFETATAGQFTCLYNRYYEEMSPVRSRFIIILFASCQHFIVASPLSLPTDIDIDIS
jgi:hypothetical protein